MANGFSGEEAPRLDRQYRVAVWRIQIVGVVDSRSTGRHAPLIYPYNYSYSVKYACSYLTFFDVHLDYTSFTPLNFVFITPSIVRIIGDHWQ